MTNGVPTAAVSCVNIEFVNFKAMYIVQCLTVLLAIITVYILWGTTCFSTNIYPFVHQAIDKYILIILRLLFEEDSFSFLKCIII